MSYEGKDNNQELDEIQKKKFEENKSKVKSEIDELLRLESEEFLRKIKINQEVVDKSKTNEKALKALEVKKAEFDVKMERLRKQQAARSMIEYEQEQERLKDLDEGWKKRSDMIDPSLKSSPIDIKDKNYPEVYKIFDSTQHYFNTDLNVGEKWGNHLQSSVMAKINYERSTRRGTYLYETIKRGKLGYDLYLLIFGLLGAFVIPVWLYRRMKPQFDFVQKELGITHKTLPELDDYDTFVDLDEISEQKTYYNLFTHEINLEKWQKFKVYKEKRELEEELYGEEPDQFEEDDDLKDFDDSK